MFENDPVHNGLLMAIGVAGMVMVVAVAMAMTAERFRVTRRLRRHAWAATKLAAACSFLGAVALIGHYLINEPIGFYTSASDFLPVEGEVRGIEQQRVSYNTGKHKTTKYSHEYFVVVDYTVNDQRYTTKRYSIPKSPLTHHSMSEVEKQAAIAKYPIGSRLMLYALNKNPECAVLIAPTSADLNQVRLAQGIGMLVCVFLLICIYGLFYESKQRGQR